MLLKRLILISRPIYWVPTLAIFWWGFLLSGASFNLYVLAGLLFFTVPEGLLIFGVNDIADRESDAINPRKGGVDGAVIKRKEIKPLTIAIFALTLLFLAIFLAGGRYRTALALVGLVIFAYTYSVEPIRLKTRPLLDSLSNGFWLICVLLAGVYVANVPITDSHELWSRIVVTFFCGCAFHALGTVLDYDTDKQIGERTIGLLMGKRSTIALATALIFYSFLAVAGNLTLRVFFGACSALSAIMFFYPDTGFIARLKIVFFYMLAILLPVVFAISHFMLRQ